MKLRRLKSSGGQLGIFVLPLFLCFVNLLYFSLILKVSSAHGAHL